MTQLLVSVRSAAEAKSLADLPIGILDVKEPTRGALGLADADVLAEITTVADKRFPMSFAAGELYDWYDFETDNGAATKREPLKPTLSKLLGADLVGRYDYVKVGLARLSQYDNWQLQWRDFFSNLEPTTSAVAVAYFDHQQCEAPDPLRIIESVSELPNCTTTLFDTFDKSHDLFQYVSAAQLRHWLETAKRHGLQTVVAGSVTLRCLNDALGTNPNFIGVRGAICNGRRDGPVDKRLCLELLNVMAAYQS